MICEIHNTNYIDLYNKLKDQNERTFIVQYGNSAYEPVSIINKEIEERYAIRETMENVGMHKVPDCIISKNIFTLIVYDENGKLLSNSISTVIKYLRIMCDRYEVKNLVVLNNSFGKILTLRKIKSMYDIYFKGSRVNIFFAGRSSK